MILSYALTATLSVLLPSRGAAEDVASDRAGWWIEKFGVIEAGEDPLVNRARGVFERVLSAADKNGRRFPRLIALRGPAGQFAAALPDGTVLLTPEGLGLCYRNVPRATGDARLAFVFGHELAHLARDDFWHLFAAGDPTPRDELPEATRAREFRADSYGILYMAMAGFSPTAVLEGEGSFLLDWQGQGSLESRRRPETHPRVAERMASVRAELSSVAEELDLFAFGVRLLQLDRADDAILFLERFKDRFPSREVFNNLGLAHLYLAQRALGGCDREALLRFKLPVRIDPVTRAPGLITRAAESSCATRPLFLHHIEEAIRHLERATQADPAHAPAWTNLASALVLNGRPARALAAADNALGANPVSAAALNAKALSLHMYAGSTGIELSDIALGVLEKAQGGQPADPTTAYNTAAILAERGRPAAAATAWEAFLRLESTGPFADAARRRLNQSEPTPVTRTPAGTPPPPLPLGTVSLATEKTLKAFSARRVDLGGVTAVIYRGLGLRALALDLSLELLEEDVPRPTPVADHVARYGPPVREVEAPKGVTAVYRGFALDVSGGKVIRRIHFSE